MVTGFTVYLEFPKKEDAGSSMHAYSIWCRQCGRILTNRPRAVESDIQVWVHVQAFTTYVSWGKIIYIPWACFLTSKMIIMPMGKLL